MTVTGATDARPRAGSGRRSRQSRQWLPGWLTGSARVAVVGKGSVSQRPTSFLSLHTARRAFLLLHRYNKE
ncbi:hypothetical protein Pmani_035823 [Petrolisthes manimaculis]|uniref:Uncharacterized protein n=1 Tax=Petrolisthes manimaculis TaxID=1843537 RepID=A0AAE1NM67_9EUCA|nr:hypothetical protein Pmani_035823 [Petrolisthes manimaculis]